MLASVLAPVFLAVLAIPPLVSSLPQVTALLLAPSLLLVSFPPSPRAQEKLQRPTTPFGVSSVNVTGTARIDAEVATEKGKVVIRGAVTDDAGGPSLDAYVVLGLTRASHGGDRLSLASSFVGACRDDTQAPSLDSLGRAVLASGTKGEFCVVLALAPDRYVATLDVRGSGGLSGVSRTLLVDPSRRPVSLHFDGSNVLLELDGPTTQVDVTATSRTDPATAPPTGISLSLADDRGATLGQTVTDASGRARFEVPTGQLGNPGRGELRVRFGGNEVYVESDASIAVERRSRVELRVNVASAGRLPGLPAGERATLPVTARLACARWGCAATPTGTVEATLESGLAGAAWLEGGAAQLPLTLPTTGADAVIELRYVPAAPWFASGDPLVLSQPVGRTNAWSVASLVVAGLAVIAWLAIVRLPAVSASGSRKRPPPLPEKLGRLQLEVREPGAAASGWRGEVLDADDRIPIANATVSIERPAFDGVASLASVTCDDRGRFALDSIAFLSGDQLVATAPLHDTLRQPLPVQGELRVGLVLRRRALLDAFVAWARSRPFAGARAVEPTPGQVKRWARADALVVRWADALEQAAYGGGTVDEHAEQEVERLAPRNAHAGADGANAESPGDEARRPGPRGRLR